MYEYKDTKELNVTFSATKTPAKKRFNYFSLYVLFLIKTFGVTSGFILWLWLYLRLDRSSGLNI